MNKMGISALVALKAAVLFLAFFYFKGRGIQWLSLPLLHASLVALLVSIASLPSINLPLLLGKRTDGSFPLWSKLIFGPYLGFVQLFVLLRRFLLGRPVYTEISEGLYVGGWPSSLDHLPPGEPAVIDCTCELPRIDALNKNAYVCVATWDTRSPQPSSIESAVQWACRKRSQKKTIYIHCAFGHGRSVCIMCAVLVALGIATDWKDAERIIRLKRPFIHMNGFHRKSLEEWSKCRLSFKRTADVDLSSVIFPESS